MGSYKVIQDIEAEDKFLGPLTLKQFIFAAITVICLYLSFISITKNAYVLLFILIPPAMFFGILTWPWSSVQSTETWLIAKLRFYFKPHKRIWDQSGVKELVTITVPKKIEQHLTKNFSTSEVKSRLQALANTIDSRGWAIKNVNANPFNQSVFSADDSDRLIQVTSLPQDTPMSDVNASDDIFDDQNNTTAQKLDSLITSSTSSHKAKVVAQMSRSVSTPSAAQTQNNPVSDYWFMDENSDKFQKEDYTTIKSQVVSPGTIQQNSFMGKHSSEEDALAKQLHADRDKQKPAYEHMRNLRPISIGSNPSNTSHQQTTNNDLTTGSLPSNPVILSLASNDDLNVETIARQANKKNEASSSDEVVVSLH